MSTYSKTILVGYVGQTPELKTINQQGTQVANFSVATHKRVKGEQMTQWHPCCAFNKTAEMACERLKKGSKVFIEGELKIDKKDQKIYVQIIVNQFIEASQSQNPSSSWDDDDIGF